MDNRNNDGIRENKSKSPMPDNINNGSMDRSGFTDPSGSRVTNTSQQKAPADRRTNPPQGRRVIPGQSAGVENKGINVERVNLNAPEEVSKETVQQNRSAMREAQTNDETRVVPTNRDATRKIDTAQKTELPKEKIKNKSNSGRTEVSNTVISIVKCMAYITVVLVIAVIISVSVIFAANDIYGFVKSDEPVEITIPENATVNDVAKILHDNKIIKYEWLFKMKEGDFEGVFAPGTYTVSPCSSYDDLIYELMEKPPTGISWITIPEGYTTDEIINLFVESGIGEKEAYVDVINNYDFDYWFIDELGENWDEDGRIYRLDGYLFPDTYQFYNASSEETVIKKLLARFNQVFTEGYKLRAEELGYTVDEILNIASLIEKEAGTAADYGNVSSVFHNRLNNPTEYPYLDSDATVAYAIQHETGVRPNLTGADIDNNMSPYNSYKNAGLVPGPIANPSNSAILAALNPSETNYHFFVSSDTKTYFSATKYEHDAVIQQIMQEREENAASNE